jgi:hypothetical protein
MKLSSLLDDVAACEDAEGLEAAFGDLADAGNEADGEWAGEGDEAFSVRGTRELTVGLPSDRIRDVRSDLGSGIWMEDSWLTYQNRSWRASGEEKGG